MNSSPLGFIRTRLSQFVNDEGYAKIGDADLINYLKQSDTFSAEEYTAKLNAIQDNGDYALKSELYTALSQFEDDLIDSDKYATRDITKLDNYLSDAQTYNREFMMTVIKGIKAGLKVQTADNLESIVEPTERTLYFVKKVTPDEQGNDSYDEYLYVSGKFERFGSTRIKMNDYYTKQDIIDKKYVLDSDLSAVAKSGSYNDLKNPAPIPKTTDELSDGKDLVKKPLLAETTAKLGNAKLKRVKNYTIEGGSWVEDTTCPIEGYGFKVDIPVEGVTPLDWKVIDFFTTELVTDKLCSVVLAGENKVTLWAKENIANPVVIDTLDIESDGTVRTPEPPILKNGDLVKLGTLSVDNVEQSLPAESNQAIQYNTVNIALNDTVKGKELQWRYMEDAGKQYLVCDRNIIIGISWDALNSAGFVKGKTVTIDGKQYKCRLMTGGESETDHTCEWNKFIADNTAKIGVGNDVWHWQNVYSWCSNAYDSCRVVRGSRSASEWGYYVSWNSYLYYGFRPILEIL